MDVSDKTQVMVSHDIERGLNLADRIIILYEGKIVYQAARSEIKDIEQFRETYEYYVHEV